MQRYSAWTRNKILTHATTWKKPKGIMLSETSQIEKIKYCMIPLYEIPKVVSSYRQMEEWRLPGAGGKGEQGVIV